MRNGPQTRSKLPYRVAENSSKKATGNPVSDDREAHWSKTALTSLATKMSSQLVNAVTTLSPSTLPNSAANEPSRPLSWWTTELTTVIISEKSPNGPGWVGAAFCLIRAYVSCVKFFIA